MIAALSPSTQEPPKDAVAETEMMRAPTAAELQKDADAFKKHCATLGVSYSADKAADIVQLLAAVQARQGGPPFETAWTPQWGGTHLRIGNCIMMGCHAYLGHRSLDPGFTPLLR